MGVKVKMVTGDALAIAKETAKKLDMGTNILDAASLGDSRKEETKEVAESIEKADGFAQVFPNTSTTLWMSCKNAATLSA